MSVLCLVATGLGFVLMWPMINVVETGKTPEYPDIQPRTYAIPKVRVFDGALHAVNRLKGWELGSYDLKTGIIRSEATTPVLRFVDDVRIGVEEQGGKSVVMVRSASRIGKGDFGQNARNIRKFFRELDRQLQNSATHH